MTELYPSDAQLNAFSGGSDAEQEVLFVPIGETPYYTSFYKMLYRLLDVSRRAGDLRVYKDGGATFGVRPGRFMDGATARLFSGATLQPLTNNQTNFIYLTSAGVLTVNTSGFPSASASPHIPLATIVVSAGTFGHADIVDFRGRAIFQIPSALSPAAANTLCGGAASNADALHTHTPGMPALPSANIFVGNASNTAAPVNLSGDATLSNTGSLTIARLPSPLSQDGGNFAVAGDARHTVALLRKFITGDDVQEMTADGAAAGASNRFFIADEKAYACLVRVLCRRDTGGAHGLWLYQCVIQRTGGTVSLFGAVQLLHSIVDGNTPSGEPDITADNVNKSLKIEVSGVVGQNFRYFAVVDALELGYAD